MGFLVIGIDRNTGAAVLLTETPLPTRKSAIDALETFAATGQGDLASYDVVLVDLDAGIPVVVVQAPQAPVATLEVETAEEPPVLHETEPEEPPLPEAALEGAPETAAPLPDLGALAVDEGYPAGEAAFAADAFAALEEPPAPAEIEAVSEAGEEAPSPAASDEQDLLDALRRAADSLVQQGIEVPEPAAQEEPPAVEALEVSPLEEAVPVAEPLGVVETAPSEQAPLETDFASVVEPVRPVIMGEYPETVQPAELEPAETQPYQPSGELEIAAYTCDDCVYSNTCPKAGESSPADCGTFQWRSF